MLRVNALGTLSLTLRWIGWAIRNIVMMPAAAMFLMVCLIFIKGETPGQTIVSLIQNAQDVTDGSQWRWRECTVAPTVPPAPPAPPVPVLTEDCPEVVSDAKAYANYIDRTMWFIFGNMWVVLAIVFCGISLLFRERSNPARLHTMTILDKDSRE